MQFRLIVTVLAFSAAMGSVFAGEPYWWNNSHRDDSIFMYERGSAVHAKTEQEAVLEAVLSAKNMLVQRIGIVPALEKEGIKSNGEYAIVNTETSGIETERINNTWSAWLLLKYPQKEKQILLDRWNASIASMSDLRNREKKIPPQFALSLGTERAQTQFREGESIVFTVTAEKDCYLFLVDHMSDGTTVLLFPNRYNPDCFIKKGQQIRIPDQNNASFKLVVMPPFGDDRIEAIAATKKSSLHDKFAGLIDALPASQEVAVLSRGIFVQGLNSAVEDSSHESVEWSKAELTVSTFPR